MMMLVAAMLRSSCDRRERADPTELHGFALSGHMEAEFRVVDSRTLGT